LIVPEENAYVQNSGAPV